MGNSMDKQLLREPDIFPTEAVIAEGLGAADQAFRACINGLSAYDISLMGWRYYNDGTAWLNKGEYKWTTARGANKVKPIFWLSVWEGFFRVTFFFSPELREVLIGLSISETARDVIRNAKTIGKTARLMPVMLDISDDTQLDDVYQLVQFRKVKVK